MAFNKPLTALSVAELERLEQIDGGDTIVARFTGTDGRQIAIVMARQVAGRLAIHLSATLRANGGDLQDEAEQRILALPNDRP
jgi:hypothetical protein